LSMSNDSLRGGQGVSYGIRFSSSLLLPGIYLSLLNGEGERNP
jgi:hypothetical protein